MHIYLDGVGTLRKMYKLVAETFIGPCPYGMGVNHIDGNKLNNHFTNLEYVTPSDNSKHAYRIGLKSNRGETNGRSKITVLIVKIIRRRVEMGETQEAVARSYGLHWGTVGRIISRKTWKHVV